MQFDDNTLLPQLFGERDRNLERIERAAWRVTRRRAAIASPSPDRAGQRDIARKALQSSMSGSSAAWSRPGRGRRRFAAGESRSDKRGRRRGNEEIRTRKRRIGPRGPVRRNI